jgi:hypothetical protein
VGLYHYSSNDWNFSTICPDFYIDWFGSDWSGCCMTNYVVEFRLPLEIDSSSPKEAAMIARRRLEEQTGLDISSWYTRVFEYGETESDIGVVAEWFFSPGGLVAREVTQNIHKHEELIENGSNSEDN